MTRVAVAVAALTLGAGLVFPSPASGIAPSGKANVTSPDLVASNRSGDPQDAFRWKLAPTLTTADRWQVPRLAISQQGTVIALWEQKVADDTSALVGATLRPNGWSPEVTLGLIQPNLADIRTWPESHRATVSWISSHPGHAFGSSRTLGSLIVSRQGPGDGWETAEILYPEDAPKRPIGLYELPVALAIETQADGTTTGVLQWGDDTPLSFTWGAPESGRGLSLRAASGWQPGKMADFDVSPAGVVAAFVISPSGLEVRELRNAWRTVAVVQQTSDFHLMPDADSARLRPAGGQLELDATSTDYVVAWQQTDPKYQEDYQVWSATVTADGSVSRSQLYEAVRAVNWTNGQPRIALDVSDDGKRCLTYPLPPLGQLQGLVGGPNGWLSPITTDITLIPASSAVPSWRTRLGGLTVGLDGCLDQVWSWFSNEQALRLPEPDWDSVGMYAAASNSHVAVRLNADGTNRIQIAQLERTPAPVVQKPGAPRDVMGIATGTSIRFSWKAPLDSGGAPKVSYEWRLKGGQWRQTRTEVVSIRPAKAKVLRFEVRAINEAGAGPISRVTVRVN